MESKFQHLILLVGLPASGKSTLAKELCSQLEESVHIEFDKIENELSNNAEVFKPEVWHQARMNAYNLAKDDTQHRYIILDDNFSLKSMRKPFYQLARERQCAYYEIHLQISQQNALFRNSERSNRVPNKVIETMQVEPSLYTSQHFSIYGDNLSNLIAQLKALDHNSIPKKLQNIEIVEQVFLDKLDQSLKKEFSLYLSINPEKKKFAQALNLQRSEFYQKVKANIDKRCDEEIEVFFVQQRNGEINESELIEILTVMFKKTLQ